MKTVRHLRAVGPEPEATPVPPLAGSVSIPTERYVELLTVEHLAAEAAAKVWRGLRRGNDRIALGAFRVLLQAVRPEFIDQHLNPHEQNIRRGERGETEES